MMNRTNNYLTSISIETLKKNASIHAKNIEAERLCAEHIENQEVIAKYHSIFCTTITLQRKNSPRLQLKNNKNQYIHSNHISVYTTEFTLGSPIRNAITGNEYLHALVGTSDELFFFKISLSHGIQKSNVIGKHLYYRCPEDYERHFFTKLDDDIKKKWYTTVNNSSFDEHKTYEHANRREILYMKKKIKKFEQEFDIIKYQRKTSLLTEGFL